MSVKIVIDSASELNQEEADKLGVVFMPIEVRFGDEEFFDGVNLTKEEFFERLENSSELPKTSLINEYRWEEVFKDITDKGDEVVAISISSGLSGGYASAVEASKKFDGKVFVVDSLNATVGERMLLEYALRLKEKELSAKEIAMMLDEVKSKIRVTAMVGTLKYLKMGGRISAVSALVGEVLSIKPLVAVIDGKVKNIGKAMGTKKAINQVKNIILNDGIDFDMPYGIIWSGSSEDNLNMFIKDCSSLWEESGIEIQKYKMGSTIGTHVGPGAVGLAYFIK